MLKADWIHPSRDLGKVCPLFRKDFCIDKQVDSALLYASARGVYEATLNGQRVGDFIMAPGWTSYHNRIQVQTYDVTELLQEKNSLILQLAEGWFWRLKNPKPKAVIAQLHIAYTDGTVQDIGTDESWLVAESNLRFCHLYDGIVYDATHVPVFDTNAVIAKDISQNLLIAQEGETVKEQERLSVKEIITTPKGETVLDFGQNMTGYLEITIDAKEGDEVSFSFGEILDKKGNFYNDNYRSAKALYKYTCKEGRQTYKPTLTFYGFRYVRVDAYPAEIDPKNFTAIVVHSDIKRTGYIESSDPLLNQLFSNIVWGQKGNFLDIPTDCPQRDERLGWTGDAQVFIRTASYNYDVSRFFRKWLNDVKAEQYENGAVPDFIPSVYPRKPRISTAWADAIAICPWQCYLTYGDAEILENLFEPICKWVDYITTTTTRRNLWFGGKHYADWLELGGKYGKVKGPTRDNLVASAYYANSVNLLIKIGNVIGRDVTRYKKLYKDIRAAFIKKFRDDFKTQTEHIMALQFELTDNPQTVADSLAQLIHKQGDMIQTGFVGTPYILHVLSRYGYTELAYTLLLRREYPSWLYPISMGATTIWEHWDGIKPNGDIWPVSMNSYNHYAYGAVGDWMYGVMAGINPVEDAPGFAEVHFAPVADDRIDRFKAEIETAYGKVSSRWWHEDGCVHYEIITPVESTALIEGKEYTLSPGKYIF
ncbi:MAG: family 78 glycoside hydrolase catalytic domain [Clostridia bacterium]|nr:family 78 glycoside hydrolase catalytic domain [Clostridia bacterium]